MLCRMGEWDGDRSSRQEESPKRGDQTCWMRNPLLLPRLGDIRGVRAPHSPPPRGLSLPQSHFCSITG